uniref:Putative conserved secreted protein n=1 Tax=Rhipicephalus microplus TaxID=6941 RepID=A0A6G5A3R2_RHIMP
MSRSKVLSFFLLTSVIILIEKVSSRPSLPETPDSMVKCGYECYIKNSGVSVGCPEPCVCISKRFEENIFRGEGYCWYMFRRNTTH